MRILWLQQMKKIKQGWARKPLPGLFKSSTVVIGSLAIFQNVQWLLICLFLCNWWMLIASGLCAVSTGYQRYPSQLGIQTGVIITRRFYAPLSFCRGYSGEIFTIWLPEDLPHLLPLAILNGETWCSSESLALAWSQYQIEFQKVYHFSLLLGTTARCKWQQVPLG